MRGGSVGGLSWLIVRAVPRGRACLQSPATLWWFYGRSVGFVVAEGAGDLQVLKLP